MATSEAYSRAGVDLESAGQLKEVIKGLAQKTLGSNVVSGVGGFGGVIKLQENGDTYLVASADGVGTKLKLAAMTGRYDVAGEDIVNHCVNDILPAGARPLFFLDYVAMASYDADIVTKTVAGIAKACQAVGCALLGGETAAMPGVYRTGDYDLAGFIVGTVNKDSYVTVPHPELKPGDCVLGVPSSGLHTNGYSLVRKVFGLDDSGAALAKPVPGLDMNLEEALLEPHRCYFNELYPLMDKVYGLAHITGGGVYENIPRVLGDDYAVELRLDSWKPSPLFDYIQSEGELSQQDMFATFNMGIGMVVLVSESRKDTILKSVPGSWELGSVVEKTGKAQVLLK